MTEYVAICSSDEDDTITASVDGKAVELLARRGGRHMMETYLPVSDARTFARGILALADEIDGGEVAEEPTVTAKWGAIKPGDKVRILIDTAECADVSAGDVFTVHKVDERCVTVDDTANGGHWYFSNTESIELVDDVPAEPTDVPAPARSSRAKYVEEAKELLGSTYFDADSLTRLAEFLAGE
ncbi:hypothetical protein [Streptomyces sp. NPDC058272]|uniref:hypothetical protein n=1 Tax=Streptomyces sp. NPDC058272 TaxID=3346415 RepID=UPI0036EAFF7C